MMGKWIAAIALAGILVFPAIAVAQTSDTAPPILAGLAFDPSVVNVSVKSAAVTVTIDVTDDLSGFSNANFYLYSPSRKQSHSCNVRQRISGSPLNGRFRGTITIPANAEAGTWKVDNFYLYDSAGNGATYTTAQLAALGIPTSLEVVSIPDISPPVLTGLSFSPTTINVSTGAQDVTVTMGITDDLSGFAFGLAERSSYSVIIASSPSGQTAYSYYSSLTRASGTNTNGVFTSKIRIPQYSEQGDWSVSFSLYDNAGNRVYYHPSNMPTGLPTTFRVVSVPSDTTPPSLVNLSFVPAFINTSTSAQNVTFTFGVTDDLAGVSELRIDNVYYYICYLNLQSPSGGQNRSVGFYLNSQRVTGTPLNSVWQNSTNFPRYSEEGTWKITYGYCYDAVRNQKYMYTADLKALGLPTELVVIRPSLTVDGAIPGAAGGSVSDSAFSGRATLTAPPNVLTANTDVSIDVLTLPPSIPNPQGFGAGGSYYVNIELTPKPSGNLPAPGLTLVLPLTSALPVGTKLNLFRVNPANGTLIPAFGPDGLPIVGTVDAGGNSATFTGIVTLSTVVALKPEKVMGDLNGDGVIDCNDLAIVKASFGRRTGQVGFNPTADINNNGVVDINDLAFVSRLLPAGTVCSK